MNVRGHVEKVCFYSWNYWRLMADMSNFDETGAPVGSQPLFYLAGSQLNFLQVTKAKKLFSCVVLFVNHSYIFSWLCAAGCDVSAPD